MIYLAIIILVPSVALNIYWITRPKLKKHETIEVADLIQDLLNGSAIVKIERIDPANIFLRKIR